MSKIIILKSLCYYLATLLIGGCLALRGSWSLDSYISTGVDGFSEAFVLDLFSYVIECLMNINVVLGTGFKELDTKFLG